MASYTPNYNLYKPAGTDQFDNFLTEFGNNMDTIDANLGGGGGSSTLAGLSDVNLTSPAIDDALIYDGAEWVNSPLSAVAFSGNYSDLSGTPTIPTKTSDLNNDSNFVSDSAYVHTDNNFTNADVTKLSGIEAGAEVNVQSDWNEADNTADDYIKNKPTIPTKTSDLNNDSGFLDSSDITVTQIQSTGTKIATIDVDGNSTDLYAPTGGSGGHTIVNESGTALADEPNLQFTDGLKASDDSGNSKTKVGVDTAFTEASTRENIDSGDTLSTILGKIKKWFTDLKAVAFSGSYNDLSDKPTIPVGSDYVQKSGDTMSGQLVMNASSDVQMVLNKSHSSTTSQRTAIDIGNNIPNGTAGSCYGTVALYGSQSYYTLLSASNSTNNRNIELPDKDGYIALLSDIPDITTKVNKSGDTMTGGLNIYDSNSDTPLHIKGTNGSASFIEFLENGGTSLGYLYARSNKRAGLFFNGAYHDFGYVPTVSLLKSNIYISTADSWVFINVLTGNDSFEDYDYIGFGWHRGDNPSNWNQITSIIKASKFKDSTTSNPCYVVDDPYSATDDSRSVKIAYYGVQDIEVYRGNAVWQYRRLAIFGINF